MNFEQYYKKCDAGILINNVTKFKNNKKPKISIISSIYNKQNYTSILLNISFSLLICLNYNILRFLRSIQSQNFGQIEIILIVDFSEDNTINIIENLQKEDGRIRLLKNRKNKGTLISRNEGILISKGKYLIIPDGEDILSDNLLKNIDN